MGKWKNKGRNEDGQITYEGVGSETGDILGIYDPTIYIRTDGTRDTVMNVAKLNADRAGNESSTQWRYEMTPTRAVKMKSRANKPPIINTPAWSRLADLRNAINNGGVTPIIIEDKPWWRRLFNF